MVTVPISGADFSKKWGGITAKGMAVCWDPGALWEGRAHPLPHSCATGMLGTNCPASRLAGIGRPLCWVSCPPLFMHPRDMRP